MGAHRITARAIPSGMPADNASPRSPWARRPVLDWATALIIAIAGLNHLIWIVQDQRLPRDPGLYYKLLPRCYEWLGAPLEHASDLLAALVASSGWYNLLLALLMRAFGRSGALIELASLGWVLLVLVGTARVTRHLGSPTAALAAVMLVASMPVVMVSGRTPWIHVPEAALMLGLVLAWQADAALRRWATVAKLAALGALLLTLRHSGLPWIVTIAPLLLFSRGAPRRWGRIALVALTWSCAAVVPALELKRYMVAKMGARERYVEHLPDLWIQLGDTIGKPVLWLGILGIALLLLRRPRLPKEPVKPVLLAWMVASIVMWVVFRAGMDNFTPIGPALAVLAGLGLARLGPLGLVPPTLAATLFVVPQWVSIEAPLAPWLTRHFGLTVGTHPLNWYMPWRGFGPREVQALIDASCPSQADATCIVVVDHGLMLPFAEDPGALELFLMAEDRVRLVPMRGHRAPPRLNRVHALASFDCLDQPQDWRERYEFSEEVLHQLMEAYALKPVWTDLLWGRCGYMWHTPDGALLDPLAMPTTGTPLYQGEDP